MVLASTVLSATALPSHSMFDTHPLRLRIKPRRYCQEQRWCPISPLVCSHWQYLRGLILSLKWVSIEHWMAWQGSCWWDCWGQHHPCAQGLSCIFLESQKIVQHLNHGKVIGPKDGCIIEFCKQPQWGNQDREQTQVSTYPRSVCINPWQAYECMLWVKAHTKKSLRRRSMNAMGARDGERTPMPLLQTRQQREVAATSTPFLPLLFYIDFELPIFIN